MQPELNYRDILRAEFEQRLERNPSISLRSFSKFLGLNQTRLSDILNGRNGLSEAAARKVAAKIFESKTEQDHFVLLVASQHSRITSRKITAQKKIRLDLDIGGKISPQTFHPISDWFHFAIFELCRKKGGLPYRAKYFSERLGISEEKAKQAISSLIDLKLIHSDSRRLFASQDFVTVDSPIPSSSIRKFHRTMILKAERSIDAVSLEERDLSSLILLISKTQISQIKKLCLDFRRDLLRVIESQDFPERSHLYCLATQVFPLDSTLPKEK